jgi:RHS repeat-associated protein
MGTTSAPGLRGVPPLRRNARMLLLRKRIVAQFVYARRSNVPDFIIRGADAYRVIIDQLGSVRLLQNVASGSLPDKPFQADYSAFGEATVTTSPDCLPFGFAGGLYDPDTKLVRFRLRDYDPVIGTWTAKDPIRFASGQSNVFAYVGNDPRPPRWPRRS